MIFNRRMFKTEFYFNKFDLTVSAVNIKIELLTAGGKNTKTLKVLSSVNKTSHVLIICL